MSTGELGQLFGLSADAPVRISGLWVGNSSPQLFGGINSGGGSGLAQQALLDLRLDLGKSFNWKGASVWVQAPPLNRTELYSYVFRQDLFDKQLRLVLGKQAPSTTFANVMRPIYPVWGNFC